jgi:RNA polymerase sigma-70 factor, ECF subfamily
LEVQNNLALFEQAVMPHMDAAYNLARWLTRNDHDAEDLAQEAYLRAFKAVEALRGSDGRTWLLTIVRNTCYSWLRQNRWRDLTTVFDEEMHSEESISSNPETILFQGDDKQLIQHAVEELPLEFREVLILREIEGMSYKEIAVVAGIPAGTVMSRLARARKQLQQRLAEILNPEANSVPEDDKNVSPFPDPK